MYLMQLNEQGIQAARRSARGRLGGLIALNIALLVVLAAVTFGGSVHGAQNRGRGDYTMVGGKVPGADAYAVYIADVANQELVVMTYSQSAKAMEGVAYRNLALDAAAPRAHNRPAN
jgi:hypothetical protein